MPRRCVVAAAHIARHDVCRLPPVASPAPLMTQKFGPAFCRRLGFTVASAREDAAEMQSACPRPRSWLRWTSNARQCLVNSRDGLVRRTASDADGVDDVGDVGGDSGKQKGTAEQAAAAATAKKEAQVRRSMSVALKSHGNDSELDQGGRLVRLQWCLYPVSNPGPLDCCQRPCPLHHTVVSKRTRPTANCGPASTCSSPCSPRPSPATQKPCGSHSFCCRVSSTRPDEANSRCSSL